MTEDQMLYKNNEWSPFSLIILIVLSKSRDLNFTLKTDWQISRQSSERALAHLLGSLLVALTVTVALTLLLKENYLMAHQHYYLPKTENKSFQQNDTT